MANTKKMICMCVDRNLTGLRKIESAALAIKENPENGSRFSTMSKRAFGVSASPFKMAIIAGKKWKENRILNVCFLNGTKNQKEKVKQYAQKWSECCSVSFNFTATKSESEIRISFIADSGSWSYIGTDNLSIPKNEVTMNFGWLRDDSAENEWERVVVHEFGHALGAIHEHQNPEGGIQWNTKAVYAYFAGPPNNWSKEEVDLNILSKYSSDQLNASKYDKDSIMLYSFDGALIKGGVGTAHNTKLSSGDIKFISKQYPSN